LQAAHTAEQNLYVNLLAYLLTFYIIAVLKISTAFNLIIFRSIAAVKQQIGGSLNFVNFLLSIIRRNTMIRTYSVIELEETSGITRRTIGDYVAKGLLQGPSHRGRGATYPQSDIDALRVIPRLRTLLKSEFPHLQSVTTFLRQISPHDLYTLASTSSDQAFANTVRFIRVRFSLSSLLPQISPATITRVLTPLSTQQIAAIDSGHQNIGVVIDLAKLLNTAAENAIQPTASTETKQPREPSSTTKQFDEIAKRLQKLEEMIPA
jgi:hypothetical protein